MDADEVSRLRRVVSKLARQLNASATGEGLTPTQASVLGLVAARGPMSLATLIDLERLNPTMVSRVIGKLDDAGLIRRMPDPADSRAILVEVTFDGKAAHERIKARRTAIVSERVAELPLRDANAIARALPGLETLVDRFEQHDRRRH
jgi:DNA-binding MarR family transcriptional regulator